MQKHRLWKKLFLAVYLFLACNLVILISLYYNLETTSSDLQKIIIIALCLAIIFGIWIFLNLLPFRGSKYIGFRLLIMMGGRTLCFCSLYSFAMQFMLFLTVYPKISSSMADSRMVWGSVFYSTAVCFLLLWNGILRIFFTSKRLGIKTRLLMLLAMWIPLLNIIVLIHAANVVHAEYDFACYKKSVADIRAESHICKTRYPLVLVHGVGFRDLKYFNYWGRIPRELTRYGASVYYGNQEAFGTIVTNAEDIKKQILKIIQDTGCGKVNIIAHSKGGLDSRYAISKLGLGQYVASLTTISTPHHGCRFVDYACRLPEWLYRFVSGCFDHTFHKFGDQNPDFYTATHQFSTADSQKFNHEVPDAVGVYYQSYATQMKNCFSDLLLTLPYCLIKPLEGANDGLVSINSARWGTFKGVIKNKYHRGISHGDIIDLKREDYKGFDVIEEYVQIVSQLKMAGF